jgi:hypothetical protein
VSDDARLAHEQELREAHAQRLAETLVKRHAIFNSLPARDAAGILMLGFERRIERDGISRTEADFMLANDVRRTITALRGLFWGLPRLNEARQAVIINVAIVLGGETVRSMHSLWGALKREDYSEAADLILLSEWPALVGKTLAERRRAVDLVNTMRSGALGRIPGEAVNA